MVLLLFDEYTVRSVIMCSLGLSLNVFLETKIAFLIHFSLVFVGHVLFLFACFNSRTQENQKLRLNFKDLAARFDVFEPLEYPKL